MATYPGLPADFTSISAPEVVGVPVEDDGEPLQDLRAVAGLLVDASHADPGGAWAHLRRDVARRLQVARTRLPSGIGLLVIEGYRPLGLQHRYFVDHVAAVAALYPEEALQAWEDRAAVHVAPPWAAAHCTGGAVDLTLCDAATGAPLDLGSAVNATPETSEGRCFTHHHGLSAETAANRGLLVEVLSSVEMVNYASEWWHWSWGDRYWAHAVGARAARYGPAELPFADRSPGGRRQVISD